MFEGYKTYLTAAGIVGTGMLVKAELISQEWGMLAYAVLIGAAVTMLRNKLP